MLPGYNHNLRHRDVVFHFQTEDKGEKTATVVTQMFVDGNVIATRKSTYEKFLGRAGLVEIVKSMMQEQHKQMMKDLVESRVVAANEYLKSVGKWVEPDAKPPGDHILTTPVSPTAYRMNANSPTSPVRPVVGTTPPNEKIAQPLAKKPEPETPVEDSSEKTLDELILELISKKGKE